MKRRLLPLVLLVFLCGCGTTRGPAADRLLTSYLRKGGQAYARGADRRAREEYQQAYERACRLDDAAGRVQAAQALAVCYLAIDCPSWAHNYAAMAVADAQDAGLPDGPARALLVRALLAYDLPDEAWQVVEQLDTSSVAILTLRAETLLALDRTAEARTLLDEGWPKQAPPREEAALWAVRGMLLAADADHQAAAEAWGRSAALAQQAAPGRAAGAPLYARAADAARQAGDQRRAAEYAFRAARLAYGADMTERALTWGRQALDDARGAQDDALLGRVTLWMKLALSQMTNATAEEKR